MGRRRCLGTRRFICAVVTLTLFIAVLLEMHLLGVRQKCDDGNNSKNNFNFNNNNNNNSSSNINNNNNNSNNNNNYSSNKKNNDNKKNDKNYNYSNNSSKKESSSGFTESKYKSPTAIFRSVAIVTDSKLSSSIGVDILTRKGGNAIDAMVASHLVSSLSNAHSCGLGGGSAFVIYDRKKDEWHAIDSSGTAPAAATQDMFRGNVNNSLYGGIAVGTPGDALALWEIHRRFGQLPWREVVAPSISLCDNGVPLTQALYDAIARMLTTEKHKQDFAPYFDTNGNIKPVGSLIKLPKLAQTLRVIAEDPTSFYNGVLAQDVVNDLQDEGGIITVGDMKNYRLTWKKPTKLPLRGGYTLYSMPAPGNGPVLGYILNILAGYNMSASDVATKNAEILTYHRIVEAFKFANGKRPELGDEDFEDVSQVLSDMTSPAFGEAVRARIDDSHTHPIPYYKPSAANTDDHGTSHLSIIDRHGNAVSSTSTINTFFGSLVKGKRTGVIFNNVMHNFSISNVSNPFNWAPSPRNYIRPGKRSMSTKSPTVIWDEKNKKVRMVTGASGGIKITTAIALQIIEVLWLGKSLPESIDRRRLHHQLIPPYVHLEEGFPQYIVEGLKAKGHKVGPMTLPSVIQAIDIQDDGRIFATADFRKGGQPMGL